jgi:hypothetical protein
MEHGSHGHDARYRIRILIIITCVLATAKYLPNRFRRPCIMNAGYRRGRGKLADIKYGDPGYVIRRKVQL